MLSKMSNSKRKPCEQLVTHNDPNFDRIFFHNVQNSFVNCEFCDLTISDTAQNIEIPVHRIVIGTRIPALKIYLLDDDINIMKIDLDEELLKAIVNYCYTGELKINQETQLLPLYRFCTINGINNFQTLFDKQFDEFVTPKNALIILEEHQSNKDTDFDLIQKKCLKEIANNITTIANKPNFANISILNFGKLLRHDDFALEPENKVLEIFLKWYNEQSDFTLESNPIHPTKIIENGKNIVLSAIRLPLIESKYVKRFAEEIWRIHDANDLLNECNRRTTQKNSDTAAQNDEFRTRPRVDKKSLLAIGIGESTEGFHMEKLDGRGGKWRTLPSIKYQYKIQDKYLYRKNCVYVLYTDNENTQNVMIIGGDNSRELKKVESINLRTMKLKRMTSIQVPRERHSVAFIDNNFIYIAGGELKGKCLSSVEEYNLTTKEWKLVTPMLTERAGCQLVAFEDTIYALGGFNEDSCLDSVEYFDRNENCWVATTPMLDKRSDFGAVVHRNRIYVLGGNSHEEDVGNVATELDNVEYFDTNSKTWTRIASLNRKRDYLSAVVYQNRLIALAGYDFTAKPQNMVEEYDEEKNEWIVLSPLNAATGTMGVCVLSPFE